MHLKFEFRTARNKRYGEFPTRISLRKIRNESRSKIILRERGGEQKMSCQVKTAKKSQERKKTSGGEDINKTKILESSISLILSYEAQN